MSDHPLVRQMLSCMRVAFWLAATLFGSCAVICVLGSFSRPLSGAYAIVMLASAVGLLEARDATPPSSLSGRN